MELLLLIYSQILYYISMYNIHMYKNKCTHIINFTLWLKRWLTVCYTGGPRFDCSSHGCNSSSRGSHILFWHLWILGTHMVHSHMCKIPMHIELKFKNKLHCFLMLQHCAYLCCLRISSNLFHLSFYLYKYHYDSGVMFRTQTSWHPELDQV